MFISIVYKIIFEEKGPRKPYEFQTYRCKYCSKTFASFYGRREHETLCDKSGIKKEKFQCKECNQIFKHRGSLKHHIDGIHKVSKAQCKQCFKTFKYSCNLSRHKKKCGLKDVKKKSK